MEYDGPYHATEICQQFWTDVLRSLKLSDTLLFAAARANNEAAKRRQAEWGNAPDLVVKNLEQRIARSEASLKEKA